MKKQNHEQKTIKIHEAFARLKKERPEAVKRRLALSWSNWCFGMEPLSDTAKRLEKAGIKFVELHGNHYGPDLGYKPGETLATLDSAGIKVAGICGIFSPDNDLSSNRGVHRQAAIDYLRRELNFASAARASYILVVPGAVGRPAPYDAMEFERSAETLRSLGDEFASRGIKAAIEPIRSDEVSFAHSVAEVKRYIAAVNHPAIGHINADTYHMQSEEPHTGEAILEAGEMLANLHVADSNRRALGEGSLDLDTVIMALYLTGHNSEGRFVTPELIGPGGNPYSAMFGRTPGHVLDAMTIATADYFRERESVLLEH